MKVDYVIGDLHLNEDGMFKNIYGKTFKTQEEYIEAIVANWNKKVPTDDKVVVVLGDIGRISAFRKVLPRLRGYKILIMGNHDDYPASVYEKFFDEVYNHPVWIHRRMVLSHIPVPVESGVINVHAHTHMVKLDSPNHINLCPEWWNYTPVLVKKLQMKWGQMEKQNHKFLEEWYADIQVWNGDSREELVLDENNKIIVEPSRKLLFEKKYAHKLKKEKDNEGS